jgi:hypothetical protein
MCSPRKKANRKDNTRAFPKDAALEAAPKLGFYMFFLALRGLRPYSAGRAWFVRFVAARRICKSQF